MCLSYMKPVRGKTDTELYNGIGIYFLSSVVQFFFNYVDPETPSEFLVWRETVCY